MALGPKSDAGNTIHVNTPNPGQTDGLCSLQESIYSAEFGASIAITHTDQDTTYATGCEPGTGNGDTIVLQSGTTYSFYKSWDGDSHNYMGPTATPIIFTNITIEGNGATLQWIDNGNPENFRLFAIGTVPSSGPLAITVNGSTYSGTGSLTLWNVYIKGFHVKGGDGRGGGGGGLGAGGAIYVDEGTLTVENCTFDSNAAFGGNGSQNGSGGGGGGLAGNGGFSGFGGDAGGGARGDGGNAPGGNADGNGPGGGGGGTVFSGANGTAGGVGGPGGYLCGGNGGDDGNDGDSGQCKGGGGGGGGTSEGGVLGSFGDGADGNYGGGGGGSNGDNGGNGGFGGGGGSGASGGDGGFGGGGGFGFTGDPGKGGPFGGHADPNASFEHGGGGGALGGAIFNAGGSVTVQNSTFFNNSVARGAGGGGDADNGGDSGGAIFSFNGTLIVQYSTVTANEAVATGSGGGIVFYTADLCNSNACLGANNLFILDNTIIANTGASECGNLGTPDDLVTRTVSGTGNLILQNNADAPCPGVATTNDPQLQSLQINSPGNTPTMAILKNSPAVDAGSSSSSNPDEPLPTTDQRDVSRPQMSGFDIGAYEARPADFSFSMLSSIPLGVGTTTSVTLTVNSFEYFSAPVTLTVPTPPAGVSVSFSTNPVTPSANGSASTTMTITLAPTVTAGSYTPTIQGNASATTISAALKHSLVPTIVVSVTTGSISTVIGEFVTSKAMDSGFALSLNTKLTTAQAYIKVADKTDAITTLGAMLNELSAQSGKHITASAAAVLTTDTQALQSSLK